MIYGIRKVVQYLLGTDIAARSLAVYPDDTFIVSYPRSGNTWTRFLIASLLHPDEPVSFANIERFIPDCEAQSSRYLKRIPRPRVIKSHEYFDHRYPKVIYIVRDPRDIALSYFSFQRKYGQIADEYPLVSYVSDLVAGRLSSADWGTWGENLGSWLVRHGRPGFLLLRYEDIVAEPARELAKIAGFFDLPASPQLLAHAVEQGSAQRMRELEKTQGADWITTKGKRADIPFIGPASVGGWRAKLPLEAVVEIESAWGHLMRHVGYEVSAGVVHETVASGGQPLIIGTPGQQSRSLL